MLESQVFEADFLSLPEDQAPQASAQAILVDPSCSGSGMHESCEEEREQPDAKRLHALALFQARVLKRALAYPNVTRVVYSTCSVHQEENENVARDALTEFGHAFELEECLPAWPRRGLPTFDGAHKCLRTDPLLDRTQGFFVACFVRRNISGN